MAKWSANIGFNTLVETEPGYWEEQIVEKHYTGDVITHSIKRQNSESVNQNINISSSISIIANPFANKHCSEMTYITYMGAKWKISDISPEFPRLKLTIGDLYNGK